MAKGSRCQKGVGRLTEQELQEVKKQLWDWGCALRDCQRKQEEIQRIMDMVGVMRSTGAVKLTGMPHGTGISDTTQKSALKIIETYEVGINQLANEINQIMERKRKINSIVAQLPSVQREILELRYVKKCGWHYIPKKLNYSRSKCFDEQKKAFEKVWTFLD